MKEVITVIVFCLVLFIYLHVCFHLKKVDDLEIYEMCQPSKDKMEEVCDLRQPVVTDFMNDKLMMNCNLNSIKAAYGAYDIKIRNTKEYDDETELYVPLAISESVELFKKDKDSKYISENNSDFLEESGLINYYKNNDNEKIELLYNSELLNHNIKDNIKNYIINNINELTFQPVIRYGDSVIGITPILLRNILTNEIFLTTFDKVGNNYNLMKRCNCDQKKESCELNNYQVWTEKGWTIVQRIIRHKLNKKLYKVVTYNGFIIVTEDHSLLNNNGEIIKPTDIKTGTFLLQTFPNINNNIQYNIFINNIEFKLNEELAYFLGCYMLNGINSNYLILNNASFDITYYKYIFDKYFKNINYCHTNDIINLNLLLENNSILLDINNR